MFIADQPFVTIITATSVLWLSLCCSGYWRLVPLLGGGSIPAALRLCGLVRVMTMANRRH